MSGVPVEASWYTADSGQAVRCLLCPHGCIIPEGGAGFCGARANRAGVLCASTYGVISSYNLDPIEKKPLYHFFPGKLILSVGSYGCNLRCAFCQNHGISVSVPPPDSDTDGAALSPAQTAELAERLVPRGNIGIAYTYNEPLIGFEFVRDCAVLVRQKGLQNVLVTNGFIENEPFLELLPYIDALNIDLKAFNDTFYKRISGTLDTVRNNIRLAAQHAHVEVTTLIIPGENDNETEIDALSQFLAGIDRDIPLHLTRFFPNHQMTDKTPTPKETVLQLLKVAKRHLNHVYPGNMHA